MPFELYAEPDINRLLTAFRGEIPDRVPYLESLIEDKHGEHILGRPAGNTLGATEMCLRGLLMRQLQHHLWTPRTIFSCAKYWSKML